MPTSSLSAVIQHLLAEIGPDGGSMTDGELLTRFLRSRDGGALAALVGRHTSMVWGVCCRLLHNHHDAEDAFQATFLVLVRKAADVPTQAVANWLYGVARQTAVRLRATAAKRGRRETHVVNMPEPTAPEVRDADLQRVVDEELSRLPDHYRGVVVLCDLEGRTRKEAARQLGIPEGSVASRLARARVMLAKRLAQRGMVFSGGSAAAVLSAAAAPSVLVASTIEAASLLAAGRAAGVVSAKVAALTEGVTKAMFVTKIKSVLAVVMVVAALTGAAGLLCQTQAGEQPMTKAEQPGVKKGEEKPTQPKQLPAKSDRERLVGNWFIMNEDSGRKGEMWVITEDSILMYAKHLGLNSQRYSHRLDADKSPKRIDITVTKVNGTPLGIVKGIYSLERDELRLCLGSLDKDRPAAFPEKPGLGEVLILQRAISGASPPEAKEQKPAKTEQERMVGNWGITNDDSLRKGEAWVIIEDRILMYAMHGGANSQLYSHRLDAGKDPKEIDITVTKVNGPAIGIIKGIYALDGDELRLCLGAIGKDRPAAFPMKPAPGEVLILKRKTPDAGQPKAKVEQPAKSDRERIVGHWLIVNDDSKRKGEPWSINEDKLYMHANIGGFYPGHLYRLDAGKIPKQIELSDTKEYSPASTIKGIYVLDGDELRLCLAKKGQDRPAAFPEKPAPGEVLILQRTPPSAEQPKAKVEQPAKSDQERMVGDWGMSSADSRRRGETSWSITKDRIDRDSVGGGWQMQWYHRLDASKDPKQIDIAGQLNGAPVIKGIYVLDGDELRLCLGAGKDRPAAFPMKPAPGEVLILKRKTPDAGQPKAK